MKGILHKSKDGWMVKYTTYKTIPGIKGVMGSHSRMPKSNYLPIHPDHILHYIKDGDEFTTIDFEISEILTTDTDGTRMVKYAKLINEEKSTKRSKHKKHTNIKRLFVEDDVIKLMSMATKWDTFKDGDVEYGMDMDEFFKYLLNK
jgi:hypothetical protein